MKEIIVTFTEEDLALAEGYCNGSSCLLATALKRLGYPTPMVGGHGWCEPDHKPERGINYTHQPSKETPWDAWIARREEGLYHPSLIGYTVKLIPDAHTR